MEFPTAQACAFMTLALRGPFTSAWPSQDPVRLVAWEAAPGPGPSERRWRRRSIRWGGRRAELPAANQSARPSHRWQGRWLSEWKAVRNMLESASTVMEFLNVLFKHIL